MTMLRETDLQPAATKPPAKKKDRKATRQRLNRADGGAFPAQNEDRGARSRERLEIRLRKLGLENAALLAELADLRTQKADYYEPELSRLRSHVEHATFEKETQFLRNRLMAQCEQATRSKRAIADLEVRLAEAAQLRETWYVPELGRLSTILDDYEKTKKDWWEPQLELRAARIAELESEVERLNRALAGLTGVIEDFEKAKTEWWEPQLELRADRIAALEEQVLALQQQAAGQKAGKTARWRHWFTRSPG